MSDVIHSRYGETGKLPTGRTSRSPRQVGAVDILIVEDDEQTQAAFMSMVARMGYTPRGARTIDEALEAVMLAAPHVLITDWDLGEIRNGVDIASLALELRHNCKVLFCSGNNLPLLRTRTSHLQICRYIKKPISLSALRSEFAKVVGSI